MWENVGSHLCQDTGCPHRPTVPGWHTPLHNLCFISYPFQFIAWWSFYHSTFYGLRQWMEKWIQLTNERPTWCHLLFSLTYYALNMFRKPAKRTPPNTNRNKSSNTQRTENKTTDVVIHQHSRKLLKMDILMSEICRAHNKWNKIANDIKLVFHSSTIAIVHGPINIKVTTSISYTSYDIQ